MLLEDYKSWNEIISENEFHNFLKELFENKDGYSKTALLEIVNELSEKYLLFYGVAKLTVAEKENLHSTLLELTNFSDLLIIEDLIGILFNFRLDSYYLFLKNNATSIKFQEVKKEVLNSLKEYEEGDITGSR